MSGVHAVQDISSSTAAAPIALRPLALARPNARRAVLVLHGLLSLFVAFHAYPVTQDGPAHLYGAHILGRLASADAATYRGYFSANLHPLGNSLFSYWALAVEHYAPAEGAISTALFLALVGMPLSLLAFAQALQNGGTQRARVAPSVDSGVFLSCVLAFNYFTYRGLLNYSLSIPCAFTVLAAVVALGQARLSSRRIIALTGLAVTFATLAALAHPAAVMFLIVSIACACVRPGKVRRLVGSGVVLLLLAFTFAGRVKSDGPAHVSFMSPLTALQAFVRALGITQTWLEVVPAVLILALSLRAAVQAFPSLRRPSEWPESWPVVLAAAMGLGYFVLPFEYGGLAGLNERIPLFAVLLVLPYVHLSSRWLRWAPLVFFAFASYTVVERVHLDGLAQEIRSSTAVNVIPRGTPVYAVSLRVKLGAVSADLGRHLIADVARRRDLVAGTVFCTHPAHVLQCTAAAPPVADEGAVQSFEHLNENAQRAALADPESAIRKSFVAMRAQAESSKYLLVIGATSLNAAFERYVTSPLGARLLSPESDALRVYEVMKVGQR